MTNPMEKALAFKSELDADKEKEAVSVSKSRVEELVSESAAVRDLASSVNSERGEFAAAKAEGVKTIEEHKADRTRIQQEGKLAGKELFKSSEAKTAVTAKESPARDQIFGESIAELKRLNDSVEGIRQEMKASKEGAVSSWTEKLAEIKGKLNAFSKTYDEWALNNEVRTVQENKNQLAPKLAELEKFKNEFEANLNDAITFDEKYYYKFQDLTLEAAAQDTEQKRSVALGESNTLVDSKRALKKGFFESEKSFEEKKRQADAAIEAKRQEIDALARSMPHNQQNAVESFLEEQTRMMRSFMHPLDEDQIPKKGKYLTPEEIDQYIREKYTTVGSVIERLQRYYKDQHDSLGVTEETTRALELKRALETVKSSLEYAIQEAGK